MQAGSRPGKTTGALSFRVPEPPMIEALSKGAFIR